MKGGVFENVVVQDKVETLYQGIMAGDIKVPQVLINDGFCAKAY